jgi:hypothetical protein
MKLQKWIAAAIAITMCAGIVPAVYASDLNGTAEINCKVGDNLTVGDYPESATETQKLIDNRPDVKRQMEDIGRGLVAVKAENGNFISWRWLGTESLDVTYNLYRDGVKLNSQPLTVTNYTDNAPTSGCKYSVSTVIDGKEGEKCGEVSVWNDGYLDVPLQKPADQVLPDGKDTVTYSLATDASVGDLDGDGEYEIVLKWEPRHAKDASKGGFTGNTYFDAYKLDGTLMWRVDMGRNIRSGPHDTQFIVYDFDNDGKAEMACRTADGTVAGDGAVIGDKDAKWDLLNDGKNLQGPLYLTVFKGTDGSVIDTTEFYPQTVGTNPDGTKWDCSIFGDGWGNRSERYLGGLGFFDGEHTSFIQARGYYDRTFVSAYHVENGKIVNDWKFDSDDYNDKENGKMYSGQGNHNLAVADVDYDGLDEVIYGAMAIDHDGKPLYTTMLGHGDSQHVGDLLPSRPGLEVYSCQESRGADYGFDLRDARTGEVLNGIFTGTDNGRACTADIDPEYDGEECWSAYGVLTSADGTVLSTNYSMPTNFAIWWDGDLGRELQDGISVYKWNKKEEGVDSIFRAQGAHSINAAKSNSALTADILGDWREELIYATDDDKTLRIFTTADATSYRIPTLMHDPQYRNHVALQNVCYNQCTHTSFYLGYGTKTVPVPQMFTVENGEKKVNPDHSKKQWDIKDLYSGSTVDMVVGSPTAFVNGAGMRIENTSVEVVPYINENSRTMVPLRFVAEAFGADVEYDETNSDITITLGSTVMKMNAHQSIYTVNGQTKQMDTQPEIVRDRVFIPIRAVSEALGRSVAFYGGLIMISDLNQSISEAEALEYKEKLSQAPVPAEVDKNKYEDQLLNRPEVKEWQSSNESKAEQAADSNTETAWVGKKGDTLTAALVEAPGIPAVAISFADEKEHKFEIQYSGDGENWQIALANRVTQGKPGEYKKFFFGCPVYPKFVRYVCQDEGECAVSEFAVLCCD